MALAYKMEISASCNIVTYAVRVMWEWYCVITANCMCTVDQCHLYILYEITFILLKHSRMVRHFNYEGILHMQRARELMREPRKEKRTREPYKNQEGEKIRERMQGNQTREQGNEET